MTTRIKLRRDTAANWIEYNPILAAGEPGLETDTGKIKHGDGTTHWAGLEYANGGINPRTPVGYFMFHGPVPNSNSNDFWFEGVETDPEGNAYYTGGTYTNDSAHVVKVNMDGEVQWQKEIAWADGYEGNAVSAVYNTATSQLVVVAEMWKNWGGDVLDWQNDLGAAVIKMNAETGELVGDVTMIRDNVTEDGTAVGDVDPSDITLTAAGNPIVVGHKDGAAIPYALTTSSVGEPYGVFYVDTASFGGKLPLAYNNWYITGTNITNEVQISDVNYYDSQAATGTASTGTGATFTITNNGAGDYSVDAVVAGGNNYFVGNKITILGTDLGGATPANDATVKVTGVDGGSITSASVTGLATGTYAQYTPVSGTNIASGYNATFTGRWRIGSDGQVQFPQWGDHNGFYVNQRGSDYALNDVLYLNPNQYGGSTSATIVVTDVNEYGEIFDFTFTGTFNTSTLKIQVNDSGIDFSVDGAWTAKNYDSEAFVWTQDWAIAFGGSDFDKVNAVATDSTGNIYLACQTYDDTTPVPWGFGMTTPVLVKLDSSGNKLWAKRFSPADFFSNDNGYTGVAVDSNDDIIVAENAVITKINSEGTVIWQRGIAEYDPMEMWNTCVEVDSNDNVYVASEYDYAWQTTNDDYIIVKFDSAGNVLWQRDVGTSADEDANWNNGYQMLSVTDDRVYVAGNSYQGGDDVGLAITFPADGTGTQTEHFGQFFYHTTTWAVSTTSSVVSNIGGLSFTATTFTLTTETNITVSDLDTENTVRTLRAGDTDGRIENLYSISFEDGTVQKTAYTGSLVSADNGRFYWNTNDFYPQLEHANKMMYWYAEGWSNSVDIYIPHNDDVPFPIGTQMHFFKDQGIVSFMFWPWADIGSENDITITPSSPNFDYGMQYNMYNTGEGWSVRHPDWEQVPAKVTITKVDVNRWLLSCDSPTHVMDWDW